MQFGDKHDRENHGVVPDKPTRGARVSQSEDTHEAPRVALLVASSFLPFPGAPRCSSPPGRGDGPPYFLNRAVGPPARSLYASIELAIVS
eukprot:COSAG06_NODE_257_length_18972_cov_14.659196_8_plen_90_part_00